MTVTVHGVEGSFPDEQFAQMIADVGALPNGHGIAEGMTVGLSPSIDRTVTIAPGRATGAGVSLYSDATVSLALPANTSGNSRIDLCVAQWDWEAARAAFQAAGGEASLVAASAAARAAAGSITSIQGAPGATPVAPYDQLEQVPGTLWQEPISEQLVRNLVGVFSAPTDNPKEIRPGSQRSYAFPTLPGWTFPAQPLQLEKTADGVVFINGRFARNGPSKGPGDTGDFGGGAVVPVGFRPKRAVSILYTSQLGDATPVYGKLVILTTGLMTLYQHTGTITDGLTLRAVDTSWIGA